jgi:glycine/D-amino acid oxidase-like deaminating enzyme
MSFPTKHKYVIIGAGIHGLSTAYHLALELKNKGAAGSGKDILVIDKSAIGAGASGIACGVTQQLLPTGHASTHGPQCSRLGRRC